MCCRSIRHPSGGSQETREPDAVWKLVQGTIVTHYRCGVFATVLLVVMLQMYAFCLCEYT